MVSEAQMPCKVPSMRSRGGIIEVRWGSSLFIPGARHQRGRTWEGGSRANKVPTQMQFRPEGTWYICKPPAKTQLGREADVDMNIPGVTPAKPGCAQPLVRARSVSCVCLLSLQKFLLLPSLYFLLKVSLKKEKKLLKKKNQFDLGPSIRKKRFIQT